MNKKSVFPVFEKMDIDKCTACEACANICPVNIIEFCEDKEGFRYPSIDSEKCIGCNACVKICPVLKNPEKRTLLRKCYGGYALDNNVVLESSSGGIFTCIVNWFLKKYENGKYVGVVWNDDFTSAKYIITDNYDELSRIRVSKYVQARKGNIYQNVKNELDKGKHVLFSGCPCEVAGLKSFLKKDYDKLFTIDFVCKGPTSEKVFREYIKSVSKNRKVISMNMRVVGERPWIPQWMRIEFDNSKKIFRPFYSTVLGRTFQIFQRKSCFSCNFCGENRYSDLTLGDFHGVDTNKKYYNPDGTSEIIVNTPKGETIVDEIQCDTYLEEVLYSEIAAHNPCVEKPNSKPLMRDVFGKYLSEKNLNTAFRKTTPLKIRLIMKYKDIKEKLWAGR
ncbi:MAG: 4Fe-4S dicluster domain-containing protein [Ruminococcus sp.]|nr:4Fe-4S dicluster domain-containing protein [Ruminococcus sp.]